MGRGQELLDAARNGDKRTVEKILGQITKRSGPFTSLRRGAGVNVQDDNGYTPLHHACLNGHKEIVRLLLAVDASPCIADKRGATPLHLASWKGESSIVAMLLAHKNPPVNVDHVTADHETALLSAAHFGYTDVVAQLVARGADVTIRNIRDESALDLAAQYGRLETVQHLLHVMPQLVEPYKPSRSRGKSFTTTPLHRASKNGRKDVVQVLLAAGMDPNIRTYNGGTPLHEAACFGKASVVRILLANGADLNAVDRHGKNVHHMLSVYSEEATRKVRRVIRDYENRSRITTYESEEELPPFPVQDYSPTSYPLPNIVCDEITKDAVDSQCSNTDASLSNINIGDYKKHEPVSNADSVKNYKTLSPLLKKDIIEVSKKFRERAFTFSMNNRNNIASETRDSVNKSPQIETYHQHSPSINSECKVYENKEEYELYENKEEYEVYENKAEFKVYENDSTYEIYENLKPPRNEPDDTSPLGKKKPKPLPKPPSKPKLSVVQDNFSQVSNSKEFLNLEKQVETRKSNNSISKHICLFESKDTQYTKADESINSNDSNITVDKKLRDRKLSATVYTNTLINLPDDEKAKKYISPPEDTYMSMDKVASPYSNLPIDSCNKNNKSSLDQLMTNRLEGDKKGYLCMDRRKQYMMSRRSIPDNLSKRYASVHIKGQDGCMYEPLDYFYWYDLNPNAIMKNAHPFIRRKEKANSIPCLCPGHDGVSPKINPKNKKRDIDTSQLLYFSCEDIYVQFDDHKKYETLKPFLNTEVTKISNAQMMDSGRVVYESGESAESNNLVFKRFPKEEQEPETDKRRSNINRKMSCFKKKFDQFKALCTDWS